MASPFQQQSFRRKLTYFAAIVVLLAVSNFGLRGVEYLGKPAAWTMTAQANALQLREQDQGEVALSDSAIRLSLTGSRGLAVCFLWVAARDKQMKHEWNELELIVNSVAKLQPHFITPWLFQSWNMAFNVSVECDSPHDKYFYISRGIQMLAEGERRNRGTSDPTAEVVFPGNPDMRFHLGFYYQLKIGKSDENKTFRSLFQMSCMGPDELNLDKLAPRVEGRRRVKPAEFKKFCQRHPRLVRRLREQLKDYDTPESIVAFLEEHKDIPSRYDRQTHRLRENARDRFPLLPPRFSRSQQAFDDDEAEGSTLGDDFDNFAASREWYLFAQEPLPPPDPDFGEEGYQYDVRRYRLPRMSHYIFRQYPALAQQTIAEEQAAEGWFDHKGWKIASEGVKPVWFKDRNDNEQVLVVGEGDRYSSQRSWEDAFRRYVQYGEQTQMLMPEQKQGELKERYDLLRRQARRYERLLRQRGAGAGEPLPRKDRTPALERGIRAFNILQSMRHYRTMTNFEAHYYQADAERDSRAVAARKLYFEAKKLESEADLRQAVARYGRWIKEWKALLEEKHHFRHIDTLQEDSYEQQLHYMRRFQTLHEEPLRALFILRAQNALWPFNQLKAGAKHPLSDWLTKDQKDRIIPTRNIWGPFDGDAKDGTPFFDPQLVKRVRLRVLYPTKQKQAAQGGSPQGSKVPAGRAGGRQPPTRP